MTILSWTPFSLAESAAVLGLMASYYEHDGLVFDRDRVLVALETLIASPALGCGWLITKEHASIGYIVMTNGFSLEFGGTYQFVDELFVIEPERGKGVGAQTLAFVESRARDEGFTSIHLEVELDNRGAQEFYSRLGYRGHGRHLWSKALSGDPA